MSVNRFCMHSFDDVAANASNSTAFSRYCSTVRMALPRRLQAGRRKPFIDVRRSLGLACLADNLFPLGALRQFFSYGAEARGFLFETFRER
jgi:hypothetical protein